MMDQMEARTMSRSALRHRPISQTAQPSQVQTPRASRTKSQPYQADEITSTVIPKRSPRASRSWVIYTLLGMLAAILLLMIGQTLWNWGRVLSDDLHYGRPRTTQVDHFVGHETGNTPSHFIALNMSGQIYVVEIPGGSAKTSRLLVGPHLVGQDADLAPVTLSFVGDTAHPDLVVVVSGIQVRFHNTGTEYVSTQ